MNLLLGKTVLITGASSGIGKATALEYAKNGTHLILCARRTEKLLELERKIKVDFPNVRVLPLTLDVRYRKTVFDQIKSLPNSFKNIDILVNNAGLVKGMDYVADVPMEKIDVMFDTNVKGLINVTQAVLPGMKERNSGIIVNINSIAGTETYPGGGGYCGSKHAVTAITKSLRHELVSTPINVISIEPGK
jgi:3-hydroxy acid dehydrogenase / malonic semialdehyde reductase